jgi:hypothetical protein
VPKEEQQGAEGECVDRPKKATVPF